MTCCRGYVAVCVAALFLTKADAADTVRVGSKSFTESTILGELATQLGNAAGVITVHQSQLGGTRVLWEALLSGRIDVYPEYSGAIVQELLPGTPADLPAIKTALQRHGIGMTQALGFDNTYAIGVPESLARRWNLHSVNDLQEHPELRYGLSNEFLSRKDGWPTLKKAYGLSPESVTGLDHDLAYAAISSGSVDVMDLYSTDAEIAFYHLQTMTDDKHVFPEYKAVYIYRLDLHERAPQFVKALTRLEGAIDAKTMIGMNASTKLHEVPEPAVASKFLFTHFQVKTNPAENGFASELVHRNWEHLALVGISLLASILVAIPLGVLSFRRPCFGQVILLLVAAINTIPSLALLVFMIPLLGIGTLPTVVALFLYGLLPIVRSTHTGLSEIPHGLRESAIVLGLSPWARLLKIEMPLAAPTILSGIKTAAVINVGTATIGALIGAGGYGQPILTGIRMANYRLILLGAVPTAILALLIQGGFSLLEYFLVPRGLRIKVRS